MQTLSNGYKLPETGDFGDEWFPALEQNITQLNSHTHNGIDSELISINAFDAVMVDVAAGSFVDQGNGYWRASVSIPNSGDISEYSVLVRDQVTKEQIYLKVEKFTANSIYVYTNYVQDFEVHFSK